MILIGLENCEGCKLIHARHMELTYLEVPRNATPENNNIKKILAELNLSEYPMLFEDDLKTLIPLKVIEPNL